MRQIQGKLVLLRVSGEFELPRVRIIGAQMYIDTIHGFERTRYIIRLCMGICSIHEYPLEIKLDKTILFHLLVKCLFLLLHVES